MEFGVVVVMWEYWIVELIDDELCMGDECL